MLETLIPWLYVLSLFACAMTIVLRPSLMLRPSMFFVMVMLVIINIAAAFVDKTTYSTMPGIDQLRLTTILFPFPVLAWVLATPFLSSTTASIYGECRGTASTAFRFQRREAWIAAIFTIVALFVAAGYLVTVPLGQTGLWALLSDPANTAQAREMSVKGVSNPLVTYAYTFFRASFAPVLIVLLVYGLSWRMPFRSILLLGTILLCIVIVALEGARMPIAMLLLAVGFAWLLLRGISRGSIVFAAVVACSLAIILSLTLLRESEHRGPSRDLSMYTEPLVDRAFVVPFETGARSMFYSYDHGSTGTRTTRPAAVVANEEYINLPLTVYRRHYPFGLEYGSINTCFLFDLQVSAGLWGGWWLSLVGLCLLDLLPYLFLRARGLVLVAFYSAFLCSLLVLSFSAYTTSLLSGGLLLIPLLARASSPVETRGEPGRSTSIVSDEVGCVR